jgi:predicted transposase/invertase (TIGR01784 family)
MDILQRRPDLFQGPVFKKIASIADVASMTKEERARYDISLRQYRDTIAVLEGQYMEGESKGRAEEKLANARSLKENGVPTDVIAKSLGLTAEEIERL